MTDEKLLELAAKAAGLPVDFTFDAFGHYACGYDDDGEVLDWWNPLLDDGDALRLAVICGMNIDIEGGRSAAMVSNPASEEKHGKDRCAATRRAIVRAAAAVGARVNT